MQQLSQWQISEARKTLALKKNKKTNGYTATYVALIELTEPELSDPVRSLDKLFLQVVEQFKAKREALIEIGNCRTLSAWTAKKRSLKQI